MEGRLKEVRMERREECENGGKGKERGRKERRRK